MKKYFTRKIDSCSSCPHRKSDQNVTRWLCNHSDFRGRNGEFICWQGRDNEDTILAEWCPLPDYYPESTDFEDTNNIPVILRDKNGIEWQSKTFNVNGTEIRIATNGETVRIMSMKHMYTEVSLKEDVIYHPIEDNIKSSDVWMTEDQLDEKIKDIDYAVKGWQWTKEHGWRYKKPKPFIEEGEMDI